MLKRAAVVIGRFQPPTLGHYAVIDMVKKYVIDNQNLLLDAMPIVVIIAGKETSKDKVKNPLSGDERVRFMTGSGKADGVKFLIAGSAYDAFEKVREEGYEPVAIAAGSDRASKYLEMLDKYFEKSEDGKTIKHVAITLDRDETVSDNADDKQSKFDKNAANADILKYVDETIPVSMVSGSLARLAVKQNEFEKFAILVGLKDNVKLAKMMFNKIKNAGGTDGTA
jgi:hypothetical protein